MSKIKHTLNFSQFIRFFLLVVVVSLAGILSANLYAQENSESNQSESESVEAVGENSEEIVVSASRVPVPARHVGSSVTVIDRKHIEQRNRILSQDLLREVPGVAVSQTGPGGGTAIRIRGAEADHTQVRIDGIEMNNPSSAGSGFPLQHLPASPIGRIEVLRGPQSSIYGSDSIGGVIDITTRVPEFGTEANTKLELGSRDTRNSSVYFGSATNSEFYALSVSKIQTDGVSAKTDNDEPDAFENMFVNAKFGANLTDTINLTVVGFNSQTDVEYDGNGTNDLLGRDRKSAYSATLTSDHLDGQFDQSFKYSNTQHKREDFKNGDFDGVGNGESRKIEYQGRFNWNNANSEQTTIFALGSEKSVARNNYSWGSINRPLNYLNYTIEHRFGFENSFYSISARRDKSSNVQIPSRTTYRGTAAYAVNERIKVRTSYGTGSKNPTITEILGSGGSWAPNPDLLPETSEGWDIGLEGNLDDLDIEFSATYFENRITNHLSSDCIQNCYGVEGYNEKKPSTRQAKNRLGISNIKGLEIFANRKFGDHFEISANMTFSRGFNSKKEELVRRPHKLIGLNLNRKLNFRQATGNFNLNVQHTGSQRDGWTGNYIDLPAFTLVSLSTSMELSEILELTGRITNLTNEKYTEVNNYGVEPRSFYFGAQYKF